MLLKSGMFYDVVQVVERRRNALFEVFCRVKPGLMSCEIIPQFLLDEECVTLALHLVVDVLSYVRKLVVSLSKFVASHLNRSIFQVFDHSLIDQPQEVLYEGSVLSLGRLGQHEDFTWERFYHYRCNRLIIGQVDWNAVIVRRRLLHRGSIYVELRNFDHLVGVVRVCIVEHLDFEARFVVNAWRVGTSFRTLAIFSVRCGNIKI